MTVPQFTSGPPFHGYFNGDKKVSARMKLAHAVDGFSTKHGGQPLYCILSAEDATELEGDVLAARMTLMVRECMERGKFYVGREAPP